MSENRLTRIIFPKIDVYNNKNMTQISPYDDVHTPEAVAFRAQDESGLVFDPSDKGWWVALHMLDTDDRVIKSRGRNRRRYVLKAVRLFASIFRYELPPDVQLNPREGNVKKVAPSVSSARLRQSMRQNTKNVLRAGKDDEPGEAEPTPEAVDAAVEKAESKPKTNRYVKG